MTSFERTKQALSVFENAGRNAFAMQIPKSSNPYPTHDTLGIVEPSHVAWDRGYQAAADDAFQKDRPAKPKFERKPFKRSSTGPKFSPKPLPPANHPRFVKVVGKDAASILRGARAK